MADYIDRYCGLCEHTDGVVYTSNPPQVRCSITAQFHFYDDKCDVPTIIEEEVDDD